MLDVIAVVSNPIGYASRYRLFRDFERLMLATEGVRLTVVEAALGERPFAVTCADNPRHVQVRHTTLAWLKESMINIGMSRLPADAKYICWADADIAFRDPLWAIKTVDALQQYDVIQPWSECYDLGPNGEHLHMHRSFLRQYWNRAKRGKTYEFWHPGYVWAAKRYALEKLGGLIDFAVLGSADHHMALALIGKVEESVPGGIAPAYLRNLKVWQDRAQKHIGRNLGYLTGTIEHAYHGSKASRRYIERWSVLTSHAYDPETDIKRNLHGVVELAGNKPEFRHDIDRYHRERMEDANI
jgi:hypothetical protein